MSEVLVYIVDSSDVFVMRLAENSGGFSHLPNEGDLISTQDLKRSFAVERRCFLLQGPVDDENDIPLAALHSIFVIEVTP